MSYDHTLPQIWEQALYAIWTVNRGQWRENPDGLGDIEYVYGPRYWHPRITAAHKLHPVVHHIINRDRERPLDWQQLLLEWPHVSEDDDAMIAYTRNEDAGADFPVNGSKRQTRTSIGKYLSRHWPHVPDHIRRDWAGRYAPVKYEIWDTIEGIISGVELGPQSCMRSSYGSTPFNEGDNTTLCAWHDDRSNPEPQWHKHPYIVYQPEFGWRMAVMIDAGKPNIVIARCLVNVTDNTFVRSYTRGASDAAYSHTNDKLETWLKDQGYTKSSTWRGKKLGLFAHPDGGIMMPYIDGKTQRASVQGGYLCIESSGDLDGTNTDGQGGEARSSIGDCERCGDTVYEDDDDRIWVGQDEDELICGSCGRAHYTCVRGGDAHITRGYTEYYVRDTNVLTVRGEQYDEDNLPDYIRSLFNGGYAHEDDCVCCESDDENYSPDDNEIVEIDGSYYRKDDDTVVECRDDEWRLRSECWQDDETQHWYGDDTDHIEIDGNIYHPDTLKQRLLDAGQTSLDLEF